MNEVWNLDPLYKGFDDPAFEADLAALKSACEEEGILFSDCDWLHEEHSDLWEIDGIHFMAPLYPYWGSELIVTALYGGMTNETETLEH
jgi:hypothetical protein